MMQLIVISSPTPVLQEAATINRLFDAGLELFHVRKPGMEAHELSGLLKEIDPKNYSKVALHQHYHLSEQFSIKRLHLPEQQRLGASTEQLGAWKEKGFILSTSVHALKDHESLPAYFDYALYGPVFESISKQGYRPKEEITGLQNKSRAVKLMAIGGITPGRLEEVMQLGFDGAALLGAIWSDPVHAVHTLKACHEKLKETETC